MYLPKILIEILDLFGYDTCIMIRTPRVLLLWIESMPEAGVCIPGTTLLKPFLIFIVDGGGATRTLALFSRS